MVPVVLLLRARPQMVGVVTPLEVVHVALERAGKRHTGRDWQCPAHDDRQASLSVTQGRDGKAILNCHAGCPTEDVIAALGLVWADLFPGDRKPKAEIVATYDYTDPDGKLLYQAVRYFPKAFKRRRPDGGGGWVWTLNGADGKPAVRKVLYRLPKVLETARAGGTVYVAEGERDVGALERADATATTILGGADQPWLSAYTKALDGADVVVVADHDEAGHRFARKVAAALALGGVGARLVRAAKGKDAADHLAAGLGLDELVPLEDEPEAEVAHLTPPDSAATVPPPPAEPPKLAAELRILDRFRVAVRGCGVVGEDATAATTYLVLTSRLLDRQASLIVKGHSGSGKSYTVEQVVRFFPPEAVIVMTGMSERALIYSPEEYAHRTLVLYEAAALREGQEDNQTAYYVRSLLSEGRISYPVTVKDKDGNFTTRTIVKEGPTNLVMTTTKVAVHAENETRMLSVTTDDSREQTARVFAALADETDSGVDLTEWVQLQRWLAAADCRVTIPYAARLAELVPPVAVRLRRDFGTLLALIRAHAVLHQQTRERDDAGRIVATTDDYEQVRALVEDVIAAGVGETVSPTVRATVEAVRALTTTQDPDVEPAHPGGVTARHVATTLELDKSAARRRLQTASAAGYVFNAEDQRGKPGRWKLGEPLPGGTRLLPVESALATVPEPEPAGRDDGGTTGGTVALGSWGEDGRLLDPGPDDRRFRR
jgi:5S rRNA maturation endonuclease (ribonuclease M5)